jgi:hypothetical protein
MAGSNFIPTGGHNTAWILGMEKNLLIKHYDFLNVSTDGKHLRCIGRYKPSEISIEYTYKLKFTPGFRPNVYVSDPIIEYNDDIHMYPIDNSLCLYHPDDFSWTRSSHLYNTIIPWTHEWFLFYELYQIYGTWLHPAVLHNKNKKIKF